MVEKASAFPLEPPMGDRGLAAVSKDQAVDPEAAAGPQRLMVNRAKHVQALLDFLLR